MTDDEIRWRKALKRLGVDTVRARLSYGVADPKPESFVANIVDVPPDPRRKLIEDWLAEQDRKNWWIVILTFVGTLVAAVAAVIAAIEGMPHH